MGTPNRRAPVGRTTCHHAPRSLATLKAQAPARYGALAGMIPTGERYGVALPKGSPLAPAVDAAVAALVADGTIARLQKQWLSTNLGALPVLR